MNLTMKGTYLYFFLLAAMFLACQQEEPKKILVFSKTEGFRHESIEAGKEALAKMASENGFTIDTTEDATVFRQRDLKGYAAIVFLNTTGDCLNNQQQVQMMRFIQAGGGFVGIHAAADTEYDWPWYGRLVGAYFNGHPSDPNVRDAVIERLDASHISCQHLPDRWERTDEWYNYRDIQPDLNILLNLDESTYEGGTNGDNHSIAWYHDFDGGRAFYTGGGHTNESFAEPDYLKHLLGGIRYAMGEDVSLDFQKPSVAPEENRFQKVVLDDYLREPMELEILPDGRLMWIERRGGIWLYDPAVDSSREINHMEVFNDLEDGILGMALDPDFAENQWVYLYYSPVGDEAKQHLSRFDFTNDQLDLASEKVILEVKTQRDECCHSGGSVEFGPDGNLYFSTGDNTNPFASDGYSPSDERPGRSAWDAQKSSANTMDLRGKVMRITPQPDGTYTIPDGNLFPKDGSVGRPEIYAMGCRNPFRISIDQRTGYLYWGDVGPDAGRDSMGRGPKGHDEVNQAREAGFFGWPYFVGNNKAYHEYDFAAKQSLGKHDAKAPINNSPHNTGARELPPAQPAFIWYPYDRSEEFPLVGTGSRNAMAGPVFYMDDYPESEDRYPAYYDKKLFTYDWMRGWIMASTMDENGDFVSMERFLPSMTLNNLIDIVMSPAGDMYLLEYGTAWNSPNPDARLVHLKYISGNRTPIAVAQSSAIAGAVPFEVDFSSQGSQDPDDDELSYRWTFGDSEGMSTEANPTYTFETPGNFDVQLTVSDREGNSSTASVKVIAGNAPPELAVNIEGNQSFYWPGETVRYQVEVNDQEDGSLGGGIDQDAVALTVDYLENGADLNVIAMGHEELAAASRASIGKIRIGESDCLACHFVDQESIGPSYVEVADRYEGDPEARSYLIDKVLNGGGGVWGENAMAAHPQLTEAEAGDMIDYILSLSESEGLKTLPTEGEFSPDMATESNEDGTYVLMATYTDRGANGVDPLTTRKVMTLRHPKIQAASCDAISVASRFTPDEDQAAQGNIPAMPIIIGQDQGWVRYDQIDLTGVAALELSIILAPDFTEGGSVDLCLDSAESSPVGSVDVDFGPQNFGMKKYSIPLENVTGTHDVYLKFHGADEGVMGILTWLNFEPAPTM